MSKQPLNIILGIAALILGGLLYILFRTDTYISGILSRISLFRQWAIVARAYSNDFVKFYLPDFLWAFSLGCLLHAVTGSSGYRSVLCCIGASACGSAWELLQMLNIVSGTFDLMDILMYLLAGAVCFLINLRRENDEQI